MHFLENKITALIVFVLLTFTHSTVFAGEITDDVADLSDIPVLGAPDDKLTGRKVLEENVPSMMAPTPPDINKISEQLLSDKDNSPAEPAKKMDVIDALDDIVADEPLFINNGNDKLPEPPLAKSDVKNDTEVKVDAKSDVSEEDYDPELEEDLKDEVQSDEIAKEAVSTLDKIAIKAEKAEKYKNLFEHLSNFLNNFKSNESKKAVAGADVVKENTEEIPKEVSEENAAKEGSASVAGKVEPLDNLLDIVSPIEDTEPVDLPEEIVLSPEGEMMKEIREVKQDLTDDKIQQFAGTCLLLPEKIAGCTPYNCSMPAIHWGQEGDTVQINILGAVEDEKCVVEYQINNESLPYKYVSCNFSVTSKNVVSQVIKDYYFSGGQSIRKQYEVTPLVSNYKKVLDEEECLVRLDDGRSMSFADFQKEEDKKSTEIATEKETKPKRKISISKADKAYFDMLTAKRETLPKNKQFSNDVLETIQDIAENLAPAEIVKNDKPYQISVEHNASATKPITKKDNGTTVSSSEMNLQVTDQSKTEEIINVKEKLEMAYNALLSGQTSAAISIYKSILDHDYENQDALFGLATTYHKNKQPRQARAIYTEILKLNPNNIEALNNYLVLLAEESPDNALIELNKLERINPEFSPVPAQIAMIYLKMGSTSKAERYLRRAISLSPNNIVYRYNLAITSDRLGKIRQAIQLYNEVLDEAKSGVIIPGSIDQIEERLSFLKSKM